MAFWPKSADTKSPDTNTNGTTGSKTNGATNGAGNGTAPPKLPDVGSPPASKLPGMETIGAKAAQKQSTASPMFPMPQSNDKMANTKPSKALPADPTAPTGEQPVPPEIAAKIGELRTKIQLSIGQIVLSVMNLPRYKHQSLADLSHILVEPLLRDRVAIAHKQVKAADGSTKIDEETIAGIAIWATVSDAVDAKITEQIRAGAFPVRLGVDDWTSGENVWLLDVVAGDRKQATSVLANFRQLAGDKPVKIHPIVGRLIDPAVLEKLRNAEKTPDAKWASEGANKNALAAKPTAGRA